MNKNFWSTVFLLTGTTIGAGIFGIPYATLQVGYPAGLMWLFGLSCLTILINLAYATVISRTGERDPKQFVGYAEHYLGRWGKHAALFIILFGQWGAILAYLIGVGHFLAVILDLFGYEQLFSILVFTLMALAVWSQIRVIATLESWFTLGMILVVVLIAISGWGQITGANLTTMPKSITWVTFLMPYGVMMTALSGYAILPEMATLVNPRGLTKTVVVGTLIPAVVYLTFQLLVVGISGPQTSQEAIQGLIPFLDIGIVRLGALFGTFSMLSSYLTLSYVIKDTFLNDYDWPKTRAWAFAIVPPFLLYLVGLRSFVTALEITGVWLGTSSIILIVLMYFRSGNRNNHQQAPAWG